MRENISRNSRVIEAGHYYQAKGPTIWSRTGWEILGNHKKGDDMAMLFVDDVHPVDNVHEYERHLPCVSFPEIPVCDLIVTESSVRDSAEEALEMLRDLPSKKRARLNGSNGNQWYCSGIALTRPDNYPTCTLLDVGLTLKKHRMGFTEAINILPQFYREQQAGLLRLVQKCIPSGFNLRVILFNLDGSYEWL